MRGFIDLDSGKFILAPGVTAEKSSLDFKRSANDALEIQFCRGQVAVELPGDATGIWEVKTTNEFDADPLTGAALWVKSGTGQNTVYTFVFTWETEALDEEFMVDEDADNDVRQLTFMGAVQWTSGGKAIESATAVVNVQNNVIRDDDVLPDPGPIAFGLYFATGRQAIGSGVDFIAVVFDTALPVGATVTVVANVIKPAAADSNIFATVRNNSVDETGFTADLSAPTPANTYELSWIAFGSPP